MIFWIYEKKFLASRLRDKNYIFFILFSIELEFFVVITGIKWINFVVIVHIEIRTFLLMIFSKNHFFVDYSVGELGIQLIYAEKLVKWNWLRFLHAAVVFWRVFSWIYFDESCLSKANNWPRLKWRNLGSNSYSKITHEKEWAWMWFHELFCLDLV